MKYSGSPVVRLAACFTLVFALGAPRLITKLKAPISGAMSIPQDTRTKACSHLFGWDSDCLAFRLEDPAYFGIDSTQATHEQLRGYIEKNQQTIVALLMQIDYGRDVQRFYGPNRTDTVLNTESQKDFLGSLGQAQTLLDVLQQLTAALDALREVPALNALSESTGAISAVLQGAQITQLWARLEVSTDMYGVFDIYFPARLDSRTLNGVDANAAWSILQGSDTAPILEKIRAVSGITPDKISDVRVWLENAFVAYRLVGYSDSDDLRHAEGRAIAHLANPVLRAAPAGPPATDLVYIPSYQGAGLIEIRPSQPAARRIAKTTGFNNSLVIYNSNKNEFYVGLENGDHVAIVDGQSFTQSGKLIEGVGANTSGLELSPDGNYIAVTGSDGCGANRECQRAKVLVFDARTHTFLRRTNIPNGGFPTYALFSADTRSLFVSSGDSIYIFDSGTLELRERKTILGWQSSPMAISPDGTNLFLLQKGTLIAWSTRSHSVIHSMALPEPGIDSFHSHLQISGDGRAVWVAGWNAIYRVRLALDGYTVVQPPETAIQRQYQFAESSDGKYLYVLTRADSNANLLILNIGTSSVAWKIPGIPDPTMILVRKESSASAPPIRRRQTQNKAIPLGSTFGESAWSELRLGQSSGELMYRRDGAILYRGRQINSWPLNPNDQYWQPSVRFTPPEPHTNQIVILLWDPDRGGGSGSVLDGLSGRTTVSEIIPSRWHVLPWVSWSPDGRFALFVASGEVTMGDMVLVDVATGAIREIHYRDMTRDHGKTQFQIAEFEKLHWLSPHSYRVPITVRCNFYEVNPCDPDRVLSSRTAEVDVPSLTMRYLSAPAVSGRK
jgi:DNA-binding beta-propeller fold protein YncE